MAVNNHAWLVDKNNDTVTAFAVEAYEITTTTGIVALRDHSLAQAELIDSGKGRAEEITLTIRNISEPITPINSVVVNHHPVLKGIEVQIAEIMRPGVETPSGGQERPSCILGNLWHKLWSASAGTEETTHIVRVTWTRAAKTWVVYGVMTDYTEDYQRTKNLARATIRGVDIENAISYS